jgi:predicted TIM-barrel fold metal-dependent hydrolase
MGRYGIHVIDADGHGGDLPNWQDRIPARFQPRWEERKARIKQHFANLPGVGVKQTKGKAKLDSLDRPGMTDPKARLEDMDLEGIDQTIMFPGGAGEEWAGLDREFASILCRTLNDCRAEFLRYDPKRLMSVAKLPMIDPEAAAAELRRCVKEHGMVGMVTTQHVREKNLDHPSFDVVWRTAEELGVAVCVHGGGQAIDQVPVGVDRWSTRLEVHAFTHPVGQMMAVMAFTVGGILHRFPTLRVAFLEANTGWLPFWLDRLDEHWELTPEQAPGIDRKPSEYFLSGRCFVGADPDEREVAHVIDAVGEDVVVYASDYCHWDCAFPDTVKIVTERSDLSASAKRKMLLDNPRRLYAVA